MAGTSITHKSQQQQD